MIRLALPGCELGGVLIVAIRLHSRIALWGYIALVERNLPIYEMTVDDSLGQGVFAVSIVDHPAIESNFLALSKLEEAHFKLSSEEKRILTGPLMIPEKLILQRSEERGEHYVKATEKAIEYSRNAYHKKGNSSHAITHQHASFIGGNAFLLESWIVEDSEKDKSAALGIPQAKGTWMVSVKVNDDDYWHQNVKSGKVKGFSLEGIFGLQEEKKEKFSMSKILDTVRDAVKQVFSEKAPKEEVKIESQKEFMTVYVDIGGEMQGITFPEDSNELAVMDAEGNAIGTITFTPANEEEAAEVENKKDEKKEESVSMSKQEGEKVDLQAEIVNLKKQVFELATMTAKGARPAEKPDSIGNQKKSITLNSPYKNK